MKKTVVLLSMAGVVAVLVASLSGAFGTGSTPAVYASRLAGIQGAGTSGISVQNLDASQPATILAQFYKQGGGAPVEVPLNGVAAGAAGVMYLPSITQLSNGAYAAIISADRQIAAIASTDWNQSGAKGIYSNVTPGNSIVVPLVNKHYAAPAVDASSLISIQNTDPSAQATVKVELFANGAAGVAWSQDYTIPGGSSVTLDLGKDAAFNAVANNFLGTAKVTSATEVGVQSFINLETSAKSVYAFEGVPAESAATTLYAPLVRDRHYGFTTGLSVVNTESTPVDVTVKYMISGKMPGITACTEGQTFTDMATIPGNSGAVFYNDATVSVPITGKSTLPAGCVGGATLTATGKILAVVNDFQQANGGTSAAYNAVSAAQGATKIAAPLYRNGQKYLQSILTTGIQVMNISAQPANVQIKFANGVTNQAIPCAGGACDQTIAPGASYTWFPPTVAGIKDVRNVYGSAFITSNQPLTAIVNDYDEAGKGDAALYNGIKADIQ